MNYEYFFVKTNPKKPKVFRVYCAYQEEAIVILAHELGCTKTDTDEAAKFLTNLNIRPIRVQTVFGEEQHWTDVRRVSPAHPH